MRLGSLVVLFACTTGCARTNLQWHEVATDHLRLATNLGPAAATRQAARLETALAALAALAAPDRPLPARVDVLWIDDEEGGARLGVPASAFYLPHQPELPASPPLVVVGGKPGPDADARFMHELTHSLLVDALPGAPPWLAEGLAGWYATLRVEEGTVGFESEIRSRRAFLGIDEWNTASLRRVLEASETQYHHEALGRALYQGARHLVSLLVSSPELRPRFTDFLARLGRAEPPSQAWRATLGSLPPEALEREYRFHALAAPAPVEIVRWAGTPSLSPLSPAAVERWQARARPWDSREALIAAGDGLRRAAGDDSAERHYWSGAMAVRWRRWAEADQELRSALARAPGFAPAAAALKDVAAHLPSTR